VITIEPDYGKPGEKIYTCLRAGCGETRTEVISALVRQPLGGGGGATSPRVEIEDEDIPLPALPYDQLLCANALHKLGLFLGTAPDAEIPVFELDGSLTRIQALVLVIRLLGLEKDALAYNGENNFTDVPKWAWQYAAYAYKNGITTGINQEGTLFAPSRGITLHEFTAFILRVLDYNEKDGDFIYADALIKALEVGLYNESRLELLKAGQFIRGYAVISMVEAMLTYLKDSTDTLIETLVKKELFSEDDAKAFILEISIIVKLRQ